MEDPQNETPYSKRKRGRNQRATGYVPFAQVAPQDSELKSNDDDTSAPLELSPDGLPLEPSTFDSDNIVDLDDLPGLSDESDDDEPCHSGKDDIDSHSDDDRFDPQEEDLLLPPYGDTTVNECVAAVFGFIQRHALTGVSLITMAMLDRQMICSSHPHFVHLQIASRNFGDANSSLRSNAAAGRGEGHDEPVGSDAQEHCSEDQRCETKGQRQDMLQRSDVRRGRLLQ